MMLPPPPISNHFQQASLKYFPVDQEEPTEAFLDSSQFTFAWDDVEV